MKFLLSADWHLRLDLPRCRVDEDWFGTQKKVVQAILTEAKKRKLDIYCVGDVFNTSVVQEQLKNWLINELKLWEKETGLKIYFLAGNHDLPYHSLENIERSSIGILTKVFGFIPNTMEQFAPQFGQEHEVDWTEKEPIILFTHQLTFEVETDRPYAGKDSQGNLIKIGKTAQDLLDEFPSTKWIFTGDNHGAFHYQNGSRYVVNPGCITRQAVDFIDYKPSIFAVDTDLETVEAIYLPDTEPMVTDQYIKEENARSDRIESFVSTIQKQGKVTLNFIENLQAKIGLPDISKEVRTMTEEIIEEVKI